MKAFWTCSVHMTQTASEQTLAMCQSQKMKLLQLLLVLLLPSSGSASWLEDFDVQFVHLCEATDENDHAPFPLLAELQHCELYIFCSFEQLVSLL